MIRVILPTHLRRLANIEREVHLALGEAATIPQVLDALEAQYPMLRGTIRDMVSKQRRPFIRFFAVGQDLSHEPSEMILPAAVLEGTEPLRIVGAMAGG